MNLVYLAVAEEASAEDTTEATTNQPIEATTVAPTEATTAKAEATTEATTAKATEATTKEATSETTTEETPAPTPTPSTGLAAGEYSLISIGTIDGIDISAVKEAKGSGIKVAAATEYLAVTPAVSGTIQLTWSSNKPVVKANDADVEVTVSNNIATFAVTAGTTYKIYSSKVDSNCTMTSLVLAETATPVETSSETTTETTTVTTTETTTVTTTTQATTKETISETTTETTPAPSPVTGVNIVADSTNAKVGTQVTIPVRVTGLTSLASLDVNVAYDSSKVTVNSVSNGDVVTDSNAALSYNVANGTVGVAIANPAETVANGDVLFNLVVTPTAEGTATFTITVDEAYAAENQTIEATTTAGTLTIAKADPVGPTIVKGDADKNGLVEKNDVTTILNYVAGLISSTEIDTEAADVNEDGNVTTRDAYIIQKYLNTGSWN